MAARQVVRGTGITQVVETVIELDDLTPAQIRQLVLDWNTTRQDAGSDFGASIIQQLRLCRGILEAAGPGPYEPDSRPDFARRILELQKVAENFVAANNADQAARMAWEAGDLFARAHVKWGWEKQALSGEERARSLVTARDRHNRNVQANRRLEWRRWQTNADEIWEEHPYWSKSRVAFFVKERLELKEAPDTIARQIKKVRIAG